MVYYKTIAIKNNLKLSQGEFNEIIARFNELDRKRTDSGTFSGNSSAVEEAFGKPNLLEDAEQIKKLSLKLLPTEKTLEIFFQATFSLEFLKWEIENECRLKIFLNQMESHSAVKS